MKTFLSMLVAATACVAPTAANADGDVTIIRKVAYQPVLAELNEASPAGAGETQKLQHRVFTRRPGCTTHFVSSPGRVVTSVPRANSSTELAVGSVVTAPTNFLGSETGFVLIKVGPATHECEIVSWSPRGTTFEVPDMGLASRVSAELQLIRPDGDIVRTYRVTLIRKPDLIVHEESPEKPSAGALKTGRSVSTGGLILGSAG